MRSARLQLGSAQPACDVAGRLLEWYGRCSASAWYLQHALRIAASAERVSGSQRGAIQTVSPVASVLQLSGNVQHNSRCGPQQRRQEAALPGARLRASLVRELGSRAGCQRRSRGLQCVAQPVLTRSAARPLGGSTVDTRSIPENALHGILQCRCNAA